MAAAGEVAGVVGACVLAAMGLLHAAWAFGLRWGRDAVIPTEGRQPVIAPGRGVTLLVGFLLLLAGGLYLGAAEDRSPTWLFRTGATGVAVVLLARVVGDRRVFGITKRITDTAFARKDTRVFIPLCLVLAACGLLAAFA